MTPNASPVREVGHPVVGAARRLALETRPGQVGGKHVVAGVEQGLGRGATDLAVCSSDDDLHRESFTVA
jgi:hypothetical protein